MDLSLPVRSVIPSLDGPVLATLASTMEPVRLTELYRRTDQGSMSGVRKVLERLVEQGIVHHGPAGYVLNRDHIAAPAVLALAQLYGALVSRIRAWLSERPEKIVAVGMYGSAARREGDTTSDIDIVVITADPITSELADELADALERWTGNRGHVIVLSGDEAQGLRDQRRPIVDSWRQDLQMIYGQRSEVLGE